MNKCRWTLVLIPLLILTLVARLAPDRAAAASLLALTDTPSPAPSDTPVPTSTSTPAPISTSTPAPADPAATPIAADPLITKSSSLEEAQTGDLVEFTITATNPNTIEIPNVIVSDPLPALVDYVSATTTQGTLTYDPGSHTVTVDIGTLAPGQVVTIPIRTHVNERGQAPDTMTNMAYLTHAGGTVTTAPVTLRLVPSALPQTGFGPGPREWLLLAGLGVLGVTTLWLVIYALTRRRT